MCVCVCVYIYIYIYILSLIFFAPFFSQNEDAYMTYSQNEFLGYATARFESTTLTELPSLILRFTYIYIGVS